MKKKIVLSVTCITLLIMPLFVSAMEINISCPNEIKVNDTFTCMVSGASDELITAIKADLQYGDKLVFQSFTPNEWNGDCIDNKIGLYTADDKINTFGIGTLKFKNNGVGNNSITLNNIVFYDQNDLGIELEPISKIITIKEEDNSPAEEKPSSSSSSQKKPSSSSSPRPSSSSKEDNKNEGTGSASLIDIEISNYQIDFDKSVYEYELYIGNESTLDIDLLLENNASSYSISGNENLVEGSVIEIEVTSVDNKVNNYKINIHKDNKNIESNSGENVRIIFIVVIIVLVLINVLRIVLKKKKDVS